MMTTGHMSSAVQCASKAFATGIRRWAAMTLATQKPLPKRCHSEKKMS